MFYYLLYISYFPTHPVKEKQEPRSLSSSYHKKRGCPSRATPRRPNAGGGQSPLTRAASQRQRFDVFVRQITYALLQFENVKVEKLYQPVDVPRQ